MAKLKKTSAQLQQFRGVAENLIQREKPKETKEDIKLKFALKKLLNKTKTAHSEYLEKVEEIKVDLCLTDADGAVIIDSAGKYKFTPKNSKELTREIKRLSEIEVEIEPHIVSIPKGFPFSLIQYLEDFVFSPLTEEDMLKNIK